MKEVLRKLKNSEKLKGMSTCSKCAYSKKLSK